MGFEIASISKLVPSSHQNCSHLWQTEALIFVTSDHIYHKICNCSQLSFVAIGQNFHYWSQFSPKSHTCYLSSLVETVTNDPNFNKCSKFSQLFKIVTINQNCQIVQNCHICTKFFNLALTVIIGDNYHNWSHLFKIVTIGLICQRQTGQHWLYQVWTSLNRFGQDWTNLDKIGQIWTSLHKDKQVWTSLDKFKQVRTNLNKFEQV